ncbi:hypothetical protein Cgig2_018733 [Carnegiea gigantea]|uniref:Uncharacterized protein n=1 Tax=Carnegiea gigantea TaxID=171969 RepID=A0A9Q1GSP9_9CARY|nr:hypothetical protein Cgig2_018733 [Carnegiea gigantea]
MGEEELIRMVKKITLSDLMEQKIWYSLNYGRQMLMALEGDIDMSMIFKRNDEHNYLYVHGNEGRSVLKEANVELSSREDDTTEKGGDEGSSREGSAAGNEGNDNVWPRLGLQTRTWEEDGQVQAGVMKWKNGVGERIKQRLADIYKKMSCITAVECYSLILGKYSMELTNSRKLVVKWEMRGLPCCHDLAVIAKANLWLYDYVHPIYQSATQYVIQPTCPPDENTRHEKNK